ncbi:MAG: DUF1727 domain-containing protein [Clostridiales bacterium]|nr:DUF1727 domain-containing protein [Clostridiales bacterium]
MQSLRYHTAIASAKVVRAALRLFGRGATTLPGKVAVKVDPKILQKLCAGRDCVTITGTNGKTTTTHMITDIFRNCGYEVVTNVSGANLLSGVTTSMIFGLKAMKKAEKSGKKVICVLETDEAAYGKIACQIKPKVSLVTNLFRDQLDRFGELAHTRELIAKGLDTCEADILLNSDDSLVSELYKGREGRTLFYGLSEESMHYNNVTYPDKSGVLPASSDAEYCTSCKTKYTYTARSFGHLGAFSCSKCGKTRHAPRFYVEYDLAKNPSDEGYELTLCDGKEKKEDAGTVHLKQKVKLPIPGMHNFYNSIAAVAACVRMGEKIGDNEGLSFEKCASALEHVEAAFGRMEKIAIGDKTICVLLVKNPVGLDRALSFVAGASDADGIYMLLNSNIADGKDVSWIWDVDFESKTFPEKVYVSGDRYGDMMLRVLYSGVDRERIIAKPMEECAELLDQAISDSAVGKCLYILPNYTSMLALRSILVKRYHLKDFWK